MYPPDLSEIHPYWIFQYLSVSEIGLPVGFFFSDLLSRSRRYGDPRLDALLPGVFTGVVGNFGGDSWYAFESFAREAFSS